jgi:hypothetical protein
MIELLLIVLQSLLSSDEYKKFRNLSDVQPVTCRVEIQNGAVFV